MQVAAAIIRDENGNVLICKRDKCRHNAGLWEFPGGKREAGESMEECVVRECMEELCVTLAVDDVLAQTRYSNSECDIEFTFFLTHIANGIPAPREHSEIRWERPDTIERFEFCPADREIAACIAKGGCAAKGGSVI